MTIPNAISFARLGLVPVFVALHLSGRSGWSLACFVVAMTSDVVDGVLARLLDQRTPLGAVLDPLADKAMVVAALATLVAERVLPVWFLALVVGRDLSLAMGAWVARSRSLELAYAPTRIGKYATASLAAVITLALISEYAGSAQLRAYVVALGFVAALCVVISAAQYGARFFRGLGAARTPKEVS